MGLGIYEQSLLLFTNASEDLITKSKAREGVLHYKTCTVRQNKRSSEKPLNSGHLQTTDTGRSSQAARYMEVPLYTSSSVNSKKVIKFHGPSLHFADIILHVTSILSLLINIS